MEKLAASHDKWLAFSFRICKDKDLSQDIVQEMYLRNYQLKEDFEDKEVCMSIRTIYKDIKRAKKKEEDIKNYLLSQDFEEEQENDTEESKNNIIEYLNNEIDNLDFFEKNVLKLSLLQGQKDLSVGSGIPVRTIERTIRRIKKRIKSNYNYDN